MRFNECFVIKFLQTIFVQAVIEEKLQKLYRDGSFPGRDRYY